MYQGKVDVDMLNAVKLTHSLQPSAYPHQPYVDTFYVGILVKNKLILKTMLQLCLHWDYQSTYQLIRYVYQKDTKWSQIKDHTMHKGTVWNKPVSQSCAVAKNEKFWPATGQSNFADRIKDCSIGQSAVVWVWKLNFVVASCLSAKFECPEARQNFFTTVHDCATGLLEA